MKLPAVIAGAALAFQAAGGAPPAVAEAYARLAEARPDLIARQNTTYGRQELLRWLPFYSKALSKTQKLIYTVILSHRNHERGDAHPGYVRIAELCNCAPRTVMRNVDQIDGTGFLGVKRRLRLEDRSDGSERHHRTNLYTFPMGPLVDDALENRGADDEPAAPMPSGPTAAPAPRRLAAPTAPPRPELSSDPYWDLFEEAFVLEHRAAYGKDSKPGSVRREDLRDRASNVLHDLASECVAWARQPERGLEVEHLRVAEDLARRLARAWLRSPGRDNRHRDHGHPIGWMCCDLTRSLMDEAVEGWKRAQRRLIPKPAAPVHSEPLPASSPEESAVREAENNAVARLIRRGVGFDEALRLARAEGAKVRTALGLATPSLITSATAEPSAQPPKPG